MAWASGGWREGGVSTAVIPLSFTHPSFLPGMGGIGRTGARDPLTAVGRLGVISLWGNSEKTKEGT